MAVTRSLYESARRWGWSPPIPLEKRRLARRAMEGLASWISAAVEEAASLLRKKNGSNNWPCVSFSSRLPACGGDLEGRGSA